MFVTFKSKRLILISDFKTLSITDALIYRLNEFVSSALQNRRIRYFLGYQFERKGTKPNSLKLNFPIPSRTISYTGVAARRHLYRVFLQSTYRVCGNGRGACRSLRSRFRGLYLPLCCNSTYAFNLFTRGNSWFKQLCGTQVCIGIFGLLMFFFCTYCRIPDFLSALNVKHFYSLIKYVSLIVNRKLKNGASRF